MTGLNGRQTVPLDMWDGAPRPWHQQPDLERTLRALGVEGRLDVLRRLAAGELQPEKIAESLRLPVTEVRDHLMALEEVGLVRPGMQACMDVYQLANHAVSLLTAAPLACTLCENRGFVSGVIGDLRSASSEANEYYSRIQEMSSQVLTAHEAERKRIARELHDDTAQSLTSILVRLRLLERTAQEPEVLGNVEELRELTSGALDSVRRMAMDLRPAALDDLGLAPALQAYAERFSENWPIKVSVNVDGVRRRLPPDVELVLYRVVQEALTNVAKHSSASTALVSLSRRRNRVTLNIEDNGVGFDPGEESPSNGRGLGLFGMRERLSLVGGDVRIESTRGQGTTIIAHAPVASKRGITRRTT